MSLEPGVARAPGLYLHVPFCAHICPYCDFAVRTGSAERRARWLDFLLREIELVAASESWAPFDSVYLGGGTPSLLGAEAIGRILDTLGASFVLASDTRVFLEANPEDASTELLGALRALGVHTLSLGLQSLDDARLSFLGRSHSADTGRRAVEAALRAGFPTVSLDLIYGLPGESREDLDRELAAAIGLGVPHLSAYQLSMPERTPFGKRLRRGELVELQEEAQAEAFARVHEGLEEAGLEAYEVSNFARGPEHRSRHNQKYWDHTPYLGLGPAAHSFRDRRRWWNESKTLDYEARIAGRERPLAGDEMLGPRELAMEALMLGLRTAEGIRIAAFEASHGIDLGGRSQVLTELVDEGLLVADAGILRPTRRGMAVADQLSLTLASEFLPASR